MDYLLEKVETKLLWTEKQSIHVSPHSYCKLWLVIYVTNIYFYSLHIISQTCVSEWKEEKSTWMLQSTRSASDRLPIASYELPALTLHVHRSLDLIALCSNTRWYHVSVASTIFLCMIYFWTIFLYGLWVLYLKGTEWYTFFIRICFVFVTIYLLIFNLFSRKLGIILSSYWSLTILYYIALKFCLSKHDYYNTVCWSTKYSFLF